MEFWNHIYQHFNPIAFSIGEIKVHWYGIMYILALGVGFWTALRFAPKLGVPKEVVEEYFIWLEVGIIVGARIGFFLFYVPDNSYYLLHPWEMFNPFRNGEFVGIRGMSYHGAIIGGVIATLLYGKLKNRNLWKLADLAGLAVPVGYIFGRIGNFLNQELVGRVTDVPWGIYVNGTLRHPSQLYEGFLEGLVTFLVVYFYHRKFQRVEGELIGVYLTTYGIARFICEFWREPDPQLGFIVGWLTMGQILSLFLIGVGIGIVIYRRKFSKKE